MSLYEQTIKIDFETAKKLNYWLKNNGIFFTNYSYERLNEDETFVKTAKFEDGFEMDIKCCGSDEEAWTEAVLFDNGIQCCFSDVSDEFLGEWELEFDGNVYLVHVIPDKN